MLCRLFSFSLENIPKIHAFSRKISKLSKCSAKKVVATIFKMLKLSRFFQFRKDLRLLWYVNLQPTRVFFFLAYLSIPSPETSEEGHQQCNIGWNVSHHPYLSNGLQYVLPFIEIAGMQTYRYRLIIYGMIYNVITVMGFGNKHSRMISSNIIKAFSACKRVIESTSFSWTAFNRR